MGKGWRARGERRRGFGNEMVLGFIKKKKLCMSATALTNELRNAEYMNGGPHV